MAKPEQQINRLVNLVNSLEMFIYEPLYEKEHTDSGHWDYVCYSHQRFFKHINEAHRILGRKDDLTFVDVGCGIGTKVHLAGLLFNAHGIELSQKYARVARKINQKRKFYPYGRYKALGPGGTIMREDALKHDYSTYDVIYFFRPMSDDTMQRQLERTIWAQAKEGAIVIPIYAISNFPNCIRKMPTPSRHVYMKITDDAAARLRRRQVQRMFEA